MEWNEMKLTAHIVVAVLVFFLNFFFILRSFFVSMKKPEDKLNFNHHMCLSHIQTSSFFWTYAFRHYYIRFTIVSEDEKLSIGFVWQTVFSVPLWNDSIIQQFYWHWHVRSFIGNFLFIASIISLNKLLKRESIELEI